jgi:hypothetical protein
VAMAGAGPMGRRRRIATQWTGRTPLWSARAGLLMPNARNRIRFFEIAIRIRQIAVKHHRPGNRPLRLDRRVPTQNL